MIKCLIYCTKSKDNKLIRYYGNKHTLITKEHTIMPEPDFYLNGKIVAKFDCEKVDIIEVIERKNDKPVYISYGNVNYIGDTCLSYGQLYDYLKNKKGYAIHISNLEIIDRPYDLYEWFNKDEKPLTKAPQNMCYCYHWLGDEYILISIKPEWVEKILNGEKTIEVRKSIVNRLKKRVI